MFSDRTLQYTFIISLIIHGVIFFNPANFNSNSRDFNKIEVTYLNPKSQEARAVKNEQNRRNIALKPPHKFSTSRILPPPFVKIDDLEVIKKNMELKPQTIKQDFTALIKKLEALKPDIIAVKKSVQLKSIEIYKINSASYVSYYQTVREKIKRCAYHNYTLSEAGQVYLTFVILSDGRLRDAKVIEDKSSDNAHLRNIALKSLRDASPYPPFPKDLDYPQLTFNVIISFEIE